MCQLLPYFCPPKPKISYTHSKGKSYCIGTKMIEMSRISGHFKEGKGTMKEVLFTWKALHNHWSQTQGRNSNVSLCFSTEEPSTTQKVQTPPHPFHTARGYVELTAMQSFLMPKIEMLFDNWGCVALSEATTHSDLNTSSNFTVQWQLKTEQIDEGKDQTQRFAHVLHFFLHHLMPRDGDRTGSTAKAQILHILYPHYVLIFLHDKAVHKKTWMTRWISVKSEVYSSLSSVKYRPFGTLLRTMFS